MKRLLLAVFAVFIISSAFAQSAEGRYSSRMTRDGTLFFVMPETLKDLSGIKSFEYDMTLLSWTDSITVNFTFESALMLTPEDLEIKSADRTVKCNSYSTLYTDIKKKHYEIRITSKFGSADIEAVLESSQPPRFCFMQGGELKSASYKESAWKKDRKKLIDIFKLYQYSKLSK